MDLPETIAACDMKVGSCRHLIESMKVCEYLRSRSFLYHIFSRFCMFCALLGQDQVSVYRTIGPLVTVCFSVCPYFGGTAFQFCKIQEFYNTCTCILETEVCFHY